MAKANGMSIMPTTESIDTDREHATSRNLEAAGLRLQRAPSHLGDGFRIYYGHQILAGNEYGLSLDQIFEFMRRANIINH